MRRFETFGPDHLALLAVAVVGCVVVALLGRRRTDRTARQRPAAVGLLLVAVPLQVWQWLPSEFSRATSWPVHLCDLSWMLAAYALWSGDHRAARVLYYWGLTLVPQAMLTPDLVQVFPHPRYLMFWALHLLVVWISVWLTWGTDARPSWAGYRTTVVATVVWMAFAMTFNAVFSTNYGYLNGKPASGSVLDLLPAWPAYVAVQVVVVAAAWALMTWPWVRRGIETDQGRSATMVGS